MQPNGALKFPVSVAFASATQSIFISPKEVMFSIFLFVCFYLFVSYLSVCLLAGIRKTTKPIFMKFGGKVARGPRKTRYILVVIQIYG